MDIILLEKVENVGGIGDRVKVKSGYARNYLIPQGKATLATPENVAKFEEIRIELEKKAAEELGAAQERAASLEGQVLKLTVQSGSEGRLFGSIGTIDIAEGCAAMGIEIERSEVRLPEGPLRVIGEHTVEIHLHSDLNVPLKVVLEPSEASVVEAEAAEEEAGAEAELAEPAEPEAADVSDREAD